MCKSRTFKITHRLSVLTCTMLMSRRRVSFATTRRDPCGSSYQSDICRPRSPQHARPEQHRAVVPWLCWAATKFRPKLIYPVDSLEKKSATPDTLLIRPVNVAESQSNVMHWHGDHLRSASLLYPRAGGGYVFPHSLRSASASCTRVACRSSLIPCRIHVRIPLPGLRASRNLARDSIFLLQALDLSRSRLGTNQYLWLVHNVCPRERVYGHFNFWTLGTSTYSSRIERPIKDFSFTSPRILAMLKNHMGLGKLGFTATRLSFKKPTMPPEVDLFEHRSGLHWGHTPA